MKSNLLVRIGKETHIILRKKIMSCQRFTTSAVSPDSNAIQSLENLFLQGYQQETGLPIIHYNRLSIMDSRAIDLAESGDAGEASSGEFAALFQTIV